MQVLVESLTGSGKPQQGAVMAVQLKRIVATSNPALSTTNLLHELDASAQEVIAKVAAAQVSTRVPPYHLLQWFSEQIVVSTCHYMQLGLLLSVWLAIGQGYVSSGGCRSRKEVR